jgi:hypothetical protein
MYLKIRNELFCVPALVYCTCKSQDIADFIEFTTHGKSQEIT